MAKFIIILNKNKIQLNNVSNIAIVDIPDFKKGNITKKLVYPIFRTDFCIK